MKITILSLVALAFLSSSATATTHNITPGSVEKTSQRQKAEIVVESIEAQIESDGETDLYYDHADLKSRNSELQFESELESR